MFDTFYVQATFFCYVIVLVITFNVCRSVKVDNIVVQIQLCVDICYDIVNELFGKISYRGIHVTQVSNFRQVSDVLQVCLTSMSTLHQALALMKEQSTDQTIFKKVDEQVKSTFLEWDRIYGVLTGWMENVLPGNMCKHSLVTYSSTCSLLEYYELEVYIRYYIKYYYGEGLKLFYLR